jgi:hypothetical protein
VCCRTADVLVAVYAGATVHCVCCTRMCDGLGHHYDHQTIPNPQKCSTLALFPMQTSYEKLDYRSSGVPQGAPESERSNFLGVPSIRTV